MQIEKEIKSTSPEAILRIVSTMTTKHQAGCPAGQVAFLTFVLNGYDGSIRHLLTLVSCLESRQQRILLMRVAKAEYEAGQK